ncbi:hypothetical protein HPB50_007122 [Hyalomma asiaticum]|uniref:Uncharacterized protein n=1 Tax=Hyalomma asiaticum TaxID=266040 RepID=A0ACB7T1L4_HYAAI|nr:hypothetical protein HPB50_007122 [Hyalomma asiaticum]
MQFPKEITSNGSPQVLKYALLRLPTSKTIRASFVTLSSTPVARKCSKASPIIQDSRSQPQTCTRQCNRRQRPSLAKTITRKARKFGHLRPGDHFHEDNHVASGAADVDAVEFKTSVSTAVSRREPPGTRSLRRFSDGSAWHADKLLPLRHSRLASARPSMRGRCLRGPRVQTPCITPRHERQLSRSLPPFRRCIHGSPPRQRRVGAQITAVRMTARVRGPTGAALKGQRHRRRHRAPAGDRDASSPRMPAGVQELCRPLRVSTPSSRHACPFRIIVVVVDVVLWRAPTDDVALRQGYGRRCAALPGAQLMDVMRLRRPAEYRADDGSAVAAVGCCA